jgi:hypothetical protein
MKKITLSLVAAVLISSITPVQAAVKAGDKCTTLGQKKSASGNSFTCIKSGKKLVWNKGIVKVSVPADLAAQVSPEKLATCQIKDQRPAGSGPYWEAIAFPVTDLDIVKL